MTGPSLWHKQYPSAKGNRQSPIDITPHQLSHDPSLGPVVLNYDQCTSINISNNGHSVLVEFDDSDDRSGEHKKVFFYSVWSGFIVHKGHVYCYCYEKTMCFQLLRELQHNRGNWELQTGYSPGIFFADISC